MTDLTDIPITASARRALEEAGIPTLEALATRRREEIAGLRGVGATALAVLEQELAARGLAFGTPVTAKVTASSTTLPAPGYNSLAIVGLILAFALPPAGIVLGHVALSQIAKSGEKGRELGITALAIGYTFTVLGLIFVVVWLTVLIGMFSTIIAAVSQIPGAVGPGGLPMPGR